MSHTGTGWKPVLRFRRMTHSLTYDTLPPHSTLRREVGSDGVIKIIAAAEEPNDPTRSLVRRRTAIPAALLAAALLFVFIAALAMIASGNRANVLAGPMAVLAIAFTVFCAALFLFVWRNAYASQLDATARARQQATVLAISHNRMWIESAGPFGASSHELEAIVELRVARFGLSPAVNCLELRTASDQRIHVFPGREREELLWICRTIQNVIAAARANRTIP
jgi:hypothetical protein